MRGSDKKNWLDCSEKPCNRFGCRPVWQSAGGCPAQNSGGQGKIRPHHDLPPSAATAFIRAKLDRAYDDRLSGRISDELWTKKSAELEDELQRVRTRWPATSGRATTYRKPFDLFAKGSEKNLLRLAHRTGHFRNWLSSAA
jgi:hypothetical protein